MAVSDDYVAKNSKRYYSKLFTEKKMNIVKNIMVIAF